MIDDVGLNYSNFDVEVQLIGKVFGESSGNPVVSLILKSMNGHHGRCSIADKRANCVQDLRTRQLVRQALGGWDISRLGFLIFRMPLDGAFVRSKDDSGKTVPRSTVRKLTPKDWPIADFARQAGYTECCGLNINAVPR